jgi:chromosome partitioning protein
VPRSKRPNTGPIRLAIWFGKGGVGKSTTTMMLSLFAARRGQRTLTIDLDPECGTSRDFLGKQLPNVPNNLKTFLESPVPTSPPILPSGIDGLDIVPCAPEEQRFFRLFPEKSGMLREALDLLSADYQWILMDVPNQFDNVAELGLIAADYLILPVELTADCVERVQTAVRIIREARAFNPTLTVLGALALASVPRAGQAMGLSAKERLIFREYEEAFQAEGIRLFQTVMFRSSTTVEEARSNADERLLHWTVRRRFRRLLTEIHTRITVHSHSRSPVSYAKRHRTTQQSRATAAANA